MLRPYQEQLTAGIYDRWAAGSRNVLAVLPTGGGKTRVFAAMMADQVGVWMAIAHRSELISQISLALAGAGCPHRIIAPKPIVKWIVGLHVEQLGRSWYEPQADKIVGSVDTLIRAKNLPTVRGWICDEAHHALSDNKWGRVLSQFEGAWGAGFTATGWRADRRGLGRHADGLFDSMEIGPPTRWLIDQGFLSDYKVYGPKSDLDRSAIPVGASGEFVGKALRVEAHKSHIVGDLVDQYCSKAWGKRGITFVVDRESGIDTAGRFRKAGVPAEFVAWDTPGPARIAIMRQFAAGKIWQLVNVDMFGEGLDVPAVEVVSMGRPTQSRGLYDQQFGRCLRPSPGKDYAIVIDHVENSRQHLLPDDRRHRHTLDRADSKRSAPSSEPSLRTCPHCTFQYPRYRTACPDCGHEPDPVSRAGPEAVEGDLTMLDDAALQALRDRADDVWRPPKIPHGATPAIAQGIHNRARRRREAVQELRDSIATWAGAQSARGLSDREGYRLFYERFGTDVASACALKETDARKLGERIAADAETVR